MQMLIHYRAGALTVSATDRHAHHNGDLSRMDREARNALRRKVVGMFLHNSAPKRKHKKDA